MTEGVTVHKEIQKLQSPVVAPLFRATTTLVSRTFDLIQVSQGGLSARVLGEISASAGLVAGAASLPDDVQAVHSDLQLLKAATLAGDVKLAAMGNVKIAGDLLAVTGDIMYIASGVNSIFQLEGDLPTLLPVTALLRLPQGAVELYLLVKLQGHLERLEGPEAAAHLESLQKLPQAERLQLELVLGKAAVDAIQKGQDAISVVTLVKEKRQDRMITLLLLLVLTTGAVAKVAGQDAVAKSVAWVATAVAVARLAVGKVIRSLKNSREEVSLP